MWLGEIVVLASLALFVGCSQLGTPNDRSGGCQRCSVRSSKGCSVLVCVLCASCLLLGCQLCEFSGAVRGARYSISLLGTFSGLLDALGGPGIPVRCFIRFALPCPAASCVGKLTMVVVAVQGPPVNKHFSSRFVVSLAYTAGKALKIPPLIWPSDAPRAKNSSDDYEC